MYSILVVITTSDENIVSNKLAHLPIINVNVPFNGFYVLSPVVAAFIFVYFQLYLFKIKFLIEDLRVKYSKVEERRLYPWMLNTADYPEEEIIGSIQSAIGNFNLGIITNIFIHNYGMVYQKV
jgi:hypothetical protein